MQCSISRWGLGLSSAANLEHSYIFGFQVVALFAGLSVVAAEDRASVVLLTVVATEAAAPSGLRGGVVLFDYGRRWRDLVVTSLDRMAGSAVHVFDMLDVRELGAVCAAREFGVEGFRLNINQTLRVTDHAVAFHLRLLVETPRRVADVTFGMRADGHGQSLLGRLVAVGAFHLFAVGQFITDVQFVLFGVEKRVEVVALREVPLRRARDQPLLGVVADDTSLLRLRGELNDVTFDAGFMSWEFQTQLFVAVGGRDYVVCDLPVAGPLVARLAFQVACEIGVRDFYPSQVRLVSEAVVVYRFLRGRRLDRGGRHFVARLLTRLLAARGERSDEDCETSQRERELHYFQPDCQGQDRFQHFRILPVFTIPPLMVFERQMQRHVWRGLFNRAALR